MQVAYNFASPMRGFAAAADGKKMQVVGKVEGDTSAAVGTAEPDVLAGDAYAARHLSQTDGVEATSAEARASSSADNAGVSVGGKPKAKGWRNFRKPPSRCFPSQQR